MMSPFEGEVISRMSKYLYIERINASENFLSMQWINLARSFKLSVDKDKHLDLPFSDFF